MPDAAGEVALEAADRFLGVLALGAFAGDVAPALTWDDVDFAMRTLRIVRSRKAERRGSTKGDRFHSADFGDRLEAVLRTRQSAAMPVSRETLGFRCPRGGEPSRSDVSRDLHKHALEDAALRRTLRLHDLRHTPPRRGWPPGCP